ncbi:DUF21-domain-containing protein [Meredithblackwellia eburnea MCA 4105]
MSSRRRPQLTLKQPSILSKLAIFTSTIAPHVRNALAAPAPASTASIDQNPAKTAAIGLIPLILLKKSHEHPEPGSDEFFVKLAFSAFLVIIGGVFSGLTLGLMGLDMTNLQVLSSSGSDVEKKNADKVMKLLEKGRHWVLVCLLLSNVIVNESLPIFLDSILGGGLGAVVLSTCLIVIFGEIIPQAVCARYGLSIGAACTPFVLTLMYLEYPVAYPIAKLLDWLLGESHGTLYKKAELKTLVNIHGHVGEDMLNEDEVTIISAVLELGAKPVSHIMTPLSDTYTLPSDAVLDREKVDEILALGHSRIPIHVPGKNQDFIGMLIVKKLITYDPATAQTVGSFQLSLLPETGPDSTCLDALNYFQQGRSHILLVSSNPGVDGNALGVVTLEDVIEEMIGEEIVDETDIYVDVHNKIKVVRGPNKRAAGKALAPLIQGVIERRRGHRQRTGTVDYGSIGDGRASPNLSAGADKDLYPHSQQGSETPSPSGGVSAPLQPPLTPKAFHKVKLRGGGQPERRSDLVERIESGAVGTRTPLLQGGGQVLSSSPEREETRPLLGTRGSSTGQGR